MTRGRGQQGTTRWSAAVLSAALLGACAQAAEPSATGLPEPCEGAAPLSFVVVDRDAAEGLVDIVGVTASGELRPLTDDGASGQPAFSPDGRQIAYAHSPYPGSGQEDRTLWVMNSDGSGKHPLGDVRGVAGPAYSPDGQQIAISQLVDDKAQLSRILVLDAQGAQTSTVSPPTDEDLRFFDQQPVWTTLGGSFAFVRTIELAEGDSRSEIWAGEWPGSEFSAVYTGNSVDDLTWGRSNDELLFTDWTSSNTSDPADRVVKTLDLQTDREGSLASNAAGVVATQAGVLYFQYEPDGPNRDRLMNATAPSKAEAQLNVNSVSAPIVPICP